MVEIYTDGSADNKTKEGGFGYVVVRGDETVHKEWLGMFTSTTSARMEIMAVLDCLVWCKDNLGGEGVQIFCDNKYVVNTIDLGWYLNWKDEGWFGRKNADLWSQFLALKPQLRFEFSIKWIKSHNGNKYNEMADDLAKQGFRNKECSFEDIQVKIC